MTRRLLLPALGFALLTFLGPAQATPAFPGQNGAIVFNDLVFDPGSNSKAEIFRVNPDGSGEVRLTNDTAPDSQPTWSPDGTRIAFTRQPLCPTSCLRRIFVMNADGGGLKQITFGHEDLAIPENHSPAWSPDGTRIAYVAEDDEELLYVVNDDGSGRRKLTSTFATFILDPAWSPEGREIAFTRQVDLSTDVYSVGADGTGFRPLTQQGGAFGAAWSPDGTRVAYVNRTVWAGPLDVWVVNRDGSDPVNLTETEDVSESGPLWSPDGSTLLYTRQIAGFGEIIARDVATGSETNLTNTPSAGEAAFSWSPDGTKILYGTSAGPGVMDANGDDPVPLGSGSDPDWQPLCTINGTAEGETITGTEGRDVICAGGGNDTILGGAGNDIVFGGDGSDALLGEEGADILSGQGGNDTISPGAGDDLVVGATGIDTISFGAAVTPISLSLKTGKATGEGLDRLVSVENAIGSRVADSLAGDRLKNVLRGGAGPDSLSGAGGNDRLLGGGGNDSLNGGSGTDTCRQGAGTGPRRSCERR